MEGLLQGDWIELVKKDLQDIGITFDDDVIKKNTPNVNLSP